MVSEIQSLIMSRQECRDQQDRPNINRSLSQNLQQKRQTKEPAELVTTFVTSAVALEQYSSKLLEQFSLVIILLRML